MPRPIKKCLVLQFFLHILNHIPLQKRGHWKRESARAWRSILFPIPWHIQQGVEIHILRKRIIGKVLLLKAWGSYTDMSTSFLFLLELSLSCHRWGRPTILRNRVLGDKTTEMKYKGDTKSQKKERDITEYTLTLFHLSQENSHFRALKKNILKLWFHLSKGFNGSGELNGTELPLDRVQHVMNR